MDNTTDNTIIDLDCWYCTVMNKVDSKNPKSSFCSLCKKCDDDGYMIPYGIRLKNKDMCEVARRLEELEASQAG